MFLGLLLSCCSTTPPQGDTRVTNTVELRIALAAAKPGARILVAPGDYEGFLASNVQGDARHGIVLAAEDRSKPPVFRGGVQISAAAYLELRDLVIEGAPANGLNLDDGGTFETPAHHLLLHGLVVRDCGRGGNEDGIKLSGIDDFRLEECTVERWGRGGSAVDMVGCHRGAIEGCTIRDRETDTASSGVQMKGGTSEIAIRGSRFEHAGTRAINAGGSTGLAYFRPKPEGFEARALVIEGCTFLGSEAPIAFVGVDGALVRWNTFYRPRKWFARILQETREPGFVACRGGKFTDNLVAYLASEIATPVNVGPGTAPETFEFARNWWYCIDAPARSRPALPTPEKEPAGGADPRFLDAEKGDLRLAQDSPARAYGATGWQPPKK
jgi:hypothetical protein